MKKIFLAVVAALLLLFLFFAKQGSKVVAPSGGLAPGVTPSPSPTLTPTPIPLPDPKVYGPCRNLPVLLYHHVQPKEEAAANGQSKISVNNDTFTQQMAYLASRGYKTLTVDEFVAAVSPGSPGKSVLLTFDDGYADFYTYAYPELVKDGLRATVFLPTGLVGNPGYLTWNEIAEMRGSGLVTFADHTWSHKSLVKADETTVRYEIGTAKSQLEEHGLGPVLAFAYPFGSENKTVEKVLSDLGFRAAFTTTPGWYQCAKLPFGFRRNRVGNAQLSAYGL